MDDDDQIDIPETDPLHPFLVLRQEMRTFVVPFEVSRIKVPSALEFCRDYVNLNKPVIIEGGLEHWPALSKWSNDYLRKSVGDCEVTVDITPDGNGDCVVESKGKEWFVKPEERKMTVSSFLDILERKVPFAGVGYVQHQNDSMHTEFSSLFSDIQTDIPWASQAFNCQPDAVNMWIGNDEAVTAVHKDHYENIYCVLSGEKHFTLLPPTDLPFMHTQEFPEAVYKETGDGVWDIIPSGETIPWIPVDPDNPDLRKFPNFQHASPIHVTVKAGEILYLPSIWYHKVQQTADENGRVIAVNFWYDMQFDIKWSYYRFLETAAKQLHSKAKQ